MQLIRRFPILLPLAMAGAFSLASAARSVQAEEVMQPSAALRILAEARSADEKCKFLSISEHDELSDFVARAEIATARYQGVATADGAIGAGEKAGRSSGCGNARREMVMAALGAAREAMRQARARPARAERRKLAHGRQAPAGRPVRLIPKRKDADKRLVVRLDRRDGRTAPAQVQGRLARYVAMTAAYYADRRCKTLSYRQAVRLWKRVKNEHYALIRAAGPKAVARAKAAAIAKANSRACSARTAAAFGSGPDNT